MTKRFHVNGSHLHNNAPLDDEPSMMAIVDDCVPLNYHANCVFMLQNMEVGEFYHFPNVGTVIRLKDKAND